MQLSSRILTALAVLILAVAVVAVRAGSTGTVEAATGTIDVLNVGTCYTNDSDVFTVADCEDGDNTAGYEVAGRDTITEVGTVYATYAHDPKTAPDSPRAVLVNSNLIKISITDSGRDKRDAVLYGAGDTKPCQTELPDDNNTGDTALFCEPDGDYYKADGHLATIQKDHKGITADTYDFRWNVRGGSYGTLWNIPGSGGEKVITGITIDKGNVTNADPDGDGTNDLFKNTTWLAPTYKPMYVVDGNDSPISIYGNYTPSGGTTTFMKLNKYLTIDEDVGSGRIANEAGDDEQEVAPWFSVQVKVPDNASVDVMYVVYQTSEFESLVGGANEASYGTGKANASVNVPAFTKDETRTTDPKALVVEARSDGRVGSQNLALRETSRFSGRYEGYLKLTDENGINKNSDGKATNWGMDTADSGLCTDRGGCTDMQAAVLAVESGPVVIAYKDTDGKTLLFNVSVDTVPPSVQVDQPENKAQIQDLSPEFSGSFTDSGSGLRKDSFRAYIDHQRDISENGVTANTLALDLRVEDGKPAGNPYGKVTIAGTKKTVESHADYAGYDATETGSEFGVVLHAVVFDVDEEATGNQHRVDRRRCS